MSFCTTIKTITGRVRIAPGAADQQVVAIAAVDRIVIVTAFQCVVAAEAVQYVETT